MWSESHTESQVHTEKNFETGTVKKCAQVWKKENKMDTDSHGKKQCKNSKIFLKNKSQSDEKCYKTGGLNAM